MAVPEQYVGVPYRQVSAVLRWGKDGRPSRTDHESVRPTDETTGAFSDHAEPTLVTFAADDRVDVASLLQIGAIVPHTDHTAQASAAMGKKVDELAAHEFRAPASKRPTVPEGGD